METIVSPSRSAGAPVFLDETGAPCLFSKQPALDLHRNRLIASIFHRVQKDLVGHLVPESNHGGFFREVDRSGGHAVNRGECFFDGSLAMVTAHAVNGNNFFHRISFLSLHMIILKLRFVNSIAKRNEDHSSFLWQSPLIAQEEHPQPQEAVLPSFFFLSIFKIIARTITNKATEIKIVAIIINSISAAVQMENPLHAAAIRSKKQQLFRNSKFAV